MSKTIANFTGIGRRLELKYSDSKRAIYDDYAHHPTAIAATLSALRQKYPGRKILCIVEPHSYSRTKALLPKYKGAFGSADKVIIGPIYKARDSQSFNISGQSVVEGSGHNNISGFADLPKMLENIKIEITNYSVIIIMGAGSSHLWTEEIVKNVRK